MHSYYYDKQSVIKRMKLPFKGIGSGFESLGWMLMFIAGIKYINSNQEN
ncbi:MAG: hypothetical protein K5865_10530 [Eubacterium sp.]|nr:hypothetical protein [Eubacterium sp.]